MMPCRSRWREALVLVVVLSTSAAQAEDTSDLESLLSQPVVSGASASAESATIAPATSTSVTAEELRRYGIASLDQAINFLALGIITENPLGTVEVGTRGTLLNLDYGNHLLVVLDGHVLNEPWNGTAYFDRMVGVPFELIDHIEMILGPGSVLYGSNAMEGVINIVTKRAKDFTGLHVVAESELPISLRGGLGFGTELRLFDQPLEIIGQVEYYKRKGPSFDFAPQDYGLDAITGEPRRFTTDPVGTGIWGGRSSPAALHYDVPAAYLRATFGDFQLALRGAEAKRGTPQGWGNFNDPDKFSRDRWLSLDLQYRRALTRQLDISARLYGDLYDYLDSFPTASAEQCLEYQTDGCLSLLVGASKWAGLEVRAPFDWFGDARFVTRPGVDVRVRHVSSNMRFVDAATDVSDTVSSYALTEKAVGAYLEQTAQPLEWVNLNAGARFDYDERFGSHLSPRVAAVASAWEGGALKVIYSEAFRAPSAYEAEYEDVTYQILPVNLRPEVVRSIEGSLEQRFAGQRLLIGVFRTSWRDMVMATELTAEEIAAAVDSGALVPATTLAYQYRNESSFSNYGVNASFDGAALGRRLTYALTFTAACSDGDLRHCSSLGPLPVAAQLFGNARVAYDLGDSLPTIALAGRVAGPRLVDASDFEPRPFARRQVELRAALSGDVPGAAWLQYRLVGNWAASNDTPYSVGPLAAPQADYLRQALVPVDRLRIMLGLSATLPP